MTQWAKMNRRTRLVGVLVGVLMWVPMAAVLAQAPAKSPGSFAEQLTREIERARRQVETLYVLRLSEAVALNAEQSAKVAAIIRKAQETRRGLLEERRQRLTELKALLAEGAGAERIKPKLVQWGQNEMRLGRWRYDLFEELSPLLSVEQQARYLLFDENFNVEVRKAVLELRRGDSQRGGE